MNRIKLTNGSPPTVRKCWNIITGGGDDAAEITLYGDVCSQQPTDWWTGEPAPGLYITPEGFLDDLALIKDKAEIVVKINSGGGDLYTGIAIHNALRLNGHKTVIIEGLAASAASVIACAGDDVQVHSGSMIMIHGAAVGVADYMTSEDVKKIAKNLEAANTAIAQIYHDKTGLDLETIRSMMRAETWMVGKDAVEKKFANTLLAADGPGMSLSVDKKVLLVAGVCHDVRAFHNLPETIPVKIDASAPKAAANKNEPTVVGKQGGTSMTEKELRELYPDLVAAIETAAAESSRTSAVTQERARLQAIESIEAQIGDKELIAAAKYGKDACTAEQLALRAMQAQAKLGADHLKGLAADGKSSGVKDVAGDPNGGNGDDGNDDAAEFKGIIDAYKKQTGGIRR